MKTRPMRAGARARRLSLELTLAEASAAIGCSLSNLSRWERREVMVPERYWAGIERVLGPGVLIPKRASGAARRKVLGVRVEAKQ